MKQPDLYLCNLFIQTYSQIFFLLPIKSAIIPFAIMYSSLRKSFHLLIHRTCLLLSHGTRQSIKPEQTTGWNILTLCIRDNYRWYWESACTLGLHDLFWCVCLLLMFLGERERERENTGKVENTTKTHFSPTKITNADFCHLHFNLIFVKQKHGYIEFHLINFKVFGILSLYFPVFYPFSFSFKIFIQTHQLGSITLSCFKAQDSNYIWEYTLLHTN